MDSETNKFLDSQTKMPINSNNGQRERPERVLCYLGASLPLAKAREILPDGLFKGPAKQGDIVGDIVNYNPTHILLIEGTFRDNLSPWHKELVYALQYPGVEGVYGAASMGALRAAELDWLGMIGVGRIYEWYRTGVTEDDSEVAVSYAELPNGEYRALTVPLVDIRAGVEYYQQEYHEREHPDLAAQAGQFFEVARKIHYTERTPAVCEELWGTGVNRPPFPRMPQKTLDATLLLMNFRALKPKPYKSPAPEHLSPFFQALYERDRKIKINGIAVPQLHIDAYVMLHHPEYERICWDSANQELALLLCDCLCILADPIEVEQENARFQRRAGIETLEDFAAFLENNGWTRTEYDRLMIQNARIHKLQHAITVAKGYRRNTQSVLDYLRSHLAFDYWAIQVAQQEQAILKAGVDDWLGINVETSSWTMLQEHCDTEGLELKSLPEDYLLETGFSNATELGVALARNQAAKED